MALDRFIDDSYICCPVNGKVVSVNLKHNLYESFLWSILTVFTFHYYFHFQFHNPLLFLLSSTWQEVLFSQVQNKRCDRLWLWDRIVPLSVRQIIVVSKLTGCSHFSHSVFSCWLCVVTAEFLSESWVEVKGKISLGCLDVLSLFDTYSNAAATCLPGAALHIKLAFIASLCHLTFDVTSLLSNSFSCLAIFPAVVIN